ncbi:hypothetical protein [Flavobacterium sp.]|uniref:hypothetical protein n=1 Tax=Flavobacterium sp. TaxID=239 RepID=UPI00286E3765|nr:hypothetical protein [Flavobacterium sp.]
MKYILLVTLFHFINNISAQNIQVGKNFQSQRDDFEKAEKHLKNSDELEALYFYHYVYSIHLNTEIESIAKKN